MFTAADRRKHLKIKQQHPELEIRFVLRTAVGSYARALSPVTPIGASSTASATTTKKFQKTAREGKSIRTKFIKFKEKKIVRP